MPGGSSAVPGWLWMCVANGLMGVGEGGTQAPPGACPIWRNAFQTIGCSHMQKPSFWTGKLRDLFFKKYPEAISQLFFGGGRGWGGVGWGEMDKGEAS